MALIILEGIDRTGKSTVASYYKSLGYEVVHLSAPPKGTSSDDYLQEMIDLISSAANKDLVMDRSHYGETVWPEVYGRKPLLTEEHIEALREVEDAVGVTRLFMYDSDLGAHWQRCVDNKEPLTKVQFARARALYSKMTRDYAFEAYTLPQFLEKYPDAKDYAQMQVKTVVVQSSGDNQTVTEVDMSGPPNDSTLAKYPQSTKTPEQAKLERANVINEILSKRILKSKGSAYDELENDIREFLNSKLGKLLGGGANNSKELSLSSEEVRFYKAMYKNALEKNK
jgi:hypothetical protein